LEEEFRKLTMIGAGSEGYGPTVIIRDTKPKKQLPHFYFSP